jgi:hypothetical protein
MINTEKDIKNDSYITMIEHHRQGRIKKQVDVHRLDQDAGLHEQIHEDDDLSHKLPGGNMTNIKQSSTIQEAVTRSVEVLIINLDELILTKTHSGTDTLTTNTHNDVELFEEPYIQRMDKEDEMVESAATTMPAASVCRADEQAATTYNVVVIFEDPNIKGMNKVDGMVESADTTTPVAEVCCSQFKSGDKEIGGDAANDPLDRDIDDEATTEDAFITQTIRERHLSNDGIVDKEDKMVETDGVMLPVANVYSTIFKTKVDKIDGEDANDPIANDDDNEVSTEYAPVKQPIRVRQCSQGVIMNSGWAIQGTLSDCSREIFEPQMTTPVNKKNRAAQSFFWLVTNHF